MSQNTPNPCLLAIVLTISTHSGPQFVFHYPPQPETHDYRAAAPLKLKESELVSDSSNYDGQSSSEYSDTEHEAVVENDSDSASSSSSSLSFSTKKKSEDTSHDRKLEVGEGTTTADTTTTNVDPSKGGQLRRLQSQESRGSSSTQTASNHDGTETRNNSSENSSRRSSIGFANNTSNSNNNIEAKVWQKLLGFESEFLSELLSPPRGMCNTKFEMTVDDMVFLGLPIHISSDGVWKRRRNRQESTHQPKSGGGGKSSGPSTLVGKSKSNNDSIATSGSKGSKKNKRKQPPPHLEDQQSSGEEGDDENDTNVQGDDLSGDSDSSAEGPNEEDGGHQETQQVQEYTDPNSPMRMFNLCFVLNPPITEYNIRISEMFHCVLSSFVKCLRSEQAKSNYVWKEASKMMSIRDKATVEGYTAAKLWAEAKNKSELAQSIIQLYDTISTSSIANVAINGKLRSFQIPQVTVTYRLPELTQSLSRMGVTQLTSTTPYVEITEEDAAKGVTEHFAILLLDESESIIKDIRADPFSPLAAFIRSISPKHSVQKLALESGWSVDDVIELANSLIYWRRATAVTPLHHRNTYIVSPLANMKLLYDYIPMFRDNFPTLPSLPKLLSMLSTGKPRPFSSVIPTRDHRDVYLTALGWLMRFGFVTQLRSFLWLKATKRIKLSVARELQLEEDEKRINLDDAMDNEKLSKLKAKADTSTDNSSKAAAEAAAAATTIKRTVGFKFDEEQEENQHNNEDGEAEAENDNDEREGTFQYFGGDDLVEDTIIQSPERANSIERKWLAKMIEDKPEDIQNLFYKTMKYFNGKYTIERIMLLQKLNRQDMKKLTTALEDYVIVTRHW